MSSRWIDTAFIYFLLAILLAVALIGSVSNSPSITDGKECAQSD